VAENVTLTFRGFKKILNPWWLNRRGKIIGGWVEADRWLQNFCSGLVTLDDSLGLVTLANTVGLVTLANTALVLSPSPILSALSLSPIFLVLSLSPILLALSLSPILLALSLSPNPFRGSCFERSMLLLWCSLASSSFTLRKSSFLLDDCLNYRMYIVCHSVGTSTWIFSRSMMSTSPRCSGRATKKRRTMNAAQYQQCARGLG